MHVSSHSVSHVNSHQQSEQHSLHSAQALHSPVGHAHLCSHVHFEFGHHFRHRPTALADTIAVVVGVGVGVGWGEVVPIWVTQISTMVRASISAIIYAVKYILTLTFTYIYSHVKALTALRAGAAIATVPCTLFGPGVARILAPFQTSTDCFGRYDRGGGFLRGGRWQCFRVWWGEVRCVWACGLCSKFEENKINVTETEK